MLIIEKVKNKDNTYLIEMTRGDSLILDLDLTQINGEPAEWEVEDKIFFLLSVSFKGERDYKLLIKKEIPKDTEILELDPSETKDLVYDYDYNFQIRAQFADGRVATIIEGKLRVRGEIE